MVCIKKGRQTPIPVPDTVSSPHERSMCVCVCVFCVFVVCHMQRQSMIPRCLPLSFFFPSVSVDTGGICVLCV